MDLMSVCNQKSDKINNIFKKIYICFKTTNNRVQTSNPQAQKFTPPSVNESTAWRKESVKIHVYESVAAEWGHQLGF